MNAADQRLPAPEDCAALVEEAPVGVYVLQDGRIVYANRWLREYLGYAADDREQPEVLSLVHPEDRATVAGEIAAKLTGNGARPNYPARLIARDGGVREVEIHAKRILHGGRPAIHGMIIDISARLEAERSFQEYAARLEESNRYRQLFGDILSHDLMNPVWVAENYLRFLMDGEVPEPKRPFFEGIRGALAKARGILVDARTYLKLQDRVAFPTETVDLRPLVEEAAAGLRPLWEAKGQAVTLSLAPAADVKGNALIKEVVTNLLSNGVKYGPPGSSVEVALTAGERVRFEVRDRGPGVAEDDRERIFQRFERMEKGAISGVGLGLAIVHRVVELHGGRVWVEENPGGGSLFVAEFPAAPADG